MFTTWLIALISMMLLLAIVSYSASLWRNEKRLSGEGRKAKRRQDTDRREDLPKAA